MGVSLRGDCIYLEGACGVEDAEPLLNHLQAAPGRSVDLAEAGHLHTAVVQVLLALRPLLTGSPSDPFVRSVLMP